MPSKNALMMQAAIAFSQGCGKVPIDDSAYEWFQARYFPWIDTRKAVGKTPQEVWEDYGGDFLERFKKIGEHAATSGGTINEETLKTSAFAIETESPCPYCPLRD